MRKSRATHKKRTLGLVGLAFFVALFVPVVSLAQGDAGDPQQRCWLEQSCLDTRGLWGKSNEYVQGTGHGSKDDFSVNFCDDIGGKPTARCFAPAPNIPLEVGIPGTTHKYCSLPDKNGNYIECTADSGLCSADGKNYGTCRPGIEGGFPGYLAVFYKFFTAFLAVAAVTMVSWGGFKRIMAAGSAERIKDANDVIFKAIVGLVIALISYSLLNLINPRLVQNTLPPIEMVRPEFFGFCPMYEGNKAIYDAGYKEFTCAGGTSPGIRCYADTNCPGGQCSSGEVSFNDPGDTCGTKLLLNNRECTGQECRSRSQGCFPNSYGENPTYACSNYLFKGKLAGIEVNYIDLLPVCNNGNVPINSTPTSRDGCAVSRPNDKIVNAIDVENQSSYAIQECWDNATSPSPIRQSVCGSVGMKGFALVIERESSGMDDWYAVDASTCGGLATKRIPSYTAGSPANDDPKAVLIKQLDFSLVPASQLFDPSKIFASDGSILNPVACDLYISDKEFPDR